MKQITYLFPSEAMQNLSQLIGREITQVKRSFLKSDYFDRPLKVRDLDSDGPVELLFDSNVLMHIFPYTETFSIHLKFDAMPDMGEHFTPPVSLSSNKFFSSFVNRPITQINILASENPIPGPEEFGIQFLVSPKEGFQIEYISGKEEYFDQLRILDIADQTHSCRMCLFQ
jgi:hypothetical protein